MEIEGLIHGLATNLIFTAAAQLLEHTAPVKSEGLWFESKEATLNFFISPRSRAILTNFFMVDNCQNIVIVQECYVVKDLKSL